MAARENDNTIENLRKYPGGTRDISLLKLKNINGYFSRFMLYY